MSVSTAAMGAAELAQFLVASGTYSTLAEAMAALNIVMVDGVGAAGTAIAVSGGPAQVVVGTVGQTALDVAAQATLQATGTNVTTAGIGLLQGETTIGAAGLLGVDIGIVAAAAAPILGVALGANLYRSNPQLWTKISQKLLPFCYPGTTKIPTWAEIGQTAWETSVAKRIIDALAELFEEENIPTTINPLEGGYTSALDTGISQPIPYGGVSATSREYLSGGKHWTLSLSLSNVIAHVSNSVASYQIIVASPTPISGSIVVGTETDTCREDGTVRTYDVTATINQTYTYGNRTVYYGRASYGHSGTQWDTISGAVTTEDFGRYEGEIAWTVVYGIPHSSGEYQTGTSKWDGTTPQEIP